MCYAPVPSIEVEQPTCNTIETATSDQGADMKQNLRNRN
jgi:hypothetical protein